MNRQAGHLDEVAQSRFRHVTLPVRVGHEADGGVEAEIRTYIVLAEGLRIKGQPALQPLHEVQQKSAEKTECEQRAGIASPMLLLGFGDTAQAIDQAFDGSENRRQKIPASL